jgi:transposase
MKLFLEEFYQEYKGRDIVIIMDGAGWHKDKDYLLKDTNNIDIILQPPYSPELNPVERLWQYIKNHTIKNRVFETLDELEKAICSFWKKLTKAIIKSICSQERV